MSDFTTKWKLDLIADKLKSEIKTVTQFVKEATQKGNELGDCFKRIKAIDLYAISQSVEELKNGLGGISDLAINNEKALAEVSAITGAHGKELDELNNKAKALAKTYGEDVNQNLDTFKTILSRLGPDMGKSDAAMATLGESVNILSKTMEGDITGATDAITTSMLQFQVDLENPIKAAEESKRMINVMAAGAKEGAAEIPQISEALVQAGVSAKLANLSFEETNSAIQAMAEGGKYGSEAGVAIRNVITNMSASTKLTDTAATILKAYGVNMKKVADTSVPFSERLKELKPIQNDINALTELFGRENAAAAQILIRSADSQAELTQKITGTNVAYEQAAIIMDTTFEKEKRRTQEWNLFKMIIGEVTKQFQPYINVTAQSVSVMANMKNAYDGLAIVARGLNTLLGIDIILKKINSAVTTKLTKDQLQMAIVSRRLQFSLLWGAVSAGGFSASLGVLKIAIHGVSQAIKAIPIIGWIAAIITALIALFSWLWNNVGEFRGFFYGMWEVIKLAFGGIWETIKSTINLIVAYFKWWWSNVKTVFAWVKNVVGETWNWIANKFSWAWSVISTISSGIWNSITSVFGGVKAFMTDTFGGIWDYVSSVFDRIWDKIKGFMKFLEPLKKFVGGLWDKVKGAFNKGMNKGEKEVEEEKKSKETKGLKTSLVNLVSETSTKNIEVEPSKTIDYDKLFAKDDKKSKKGKTSSPGTGSADKLSMSGEKGNRTINMTLTINNHFSAAKQQVGDLANKIAGQITDRLRDGMVAID